MCVLVWCVCLCMCTSICVCCIDVCCIDVCLCVSTLSSVCVHLSVEYVCLCMYLC